MATMRVVSHKILPRDGAKPLALAFRIAATAPPRVTTIATLRQPAMLTGSAEDLKHPGVQRG